MGGGHPSIVGENQEERERKIEAIQRDFSSALRASTPDELERAREAMHNWEAEKREREAQARLEREPKEHDDEKREQQARDYLKREAERVVKEREGDAMSESINPKVVSSNLTPAPFRYPQGRNPGFRPFPFVRRYDPQRIGLALSIESRKVAGTRGRS